MPTSSGTPQFRSIFARRQERSSARNTQHFNVIMAAEAPAGLRMAATAASVSSARLTPDDITSRVMSSPLSVAPAVMGRATLRRNRGPLTGLVRLRWHGLPDRAGNHTGAGAENRTRPECCSLNAEPMRAASPIADCREFDCAGRLSRSTILPNNAASGPWPFVSGDRNTWAGASVEISPATPRCLP